MDNILAGVRRFQTDIFPGRREKFEHLAAKAQRPVALLITCSDSRIVPNELTGTEPGDLFLVRNAGNIVPPYGASWGGEVATIEYSISVLGIRNIIICGHSQCGAIAALTNDGDMPGHPGLNSWFQHAASTRQITRRKYPHLAGDALQVAMTEENVLVQLNHLGTHPMVAALLSTHEMNLYGWYFDIGTGRVLQYNPASEVFDDLTGDAPPPGTPTQRARGARLHARRPAIKGTA